MTAIIDQLRGGLARRLQMSGYQTQYASKLTGIGPKSEINPDGLRTVSIPIPGGTVMWGETK